MGPRWWSRSGGGQLRHVLEVLSRGVEVNLRAADLAPLVTRVERIGHRLIAGMFAAAFHRGARRARNRQPKALGSI